MESIKIDVVGNIARIIEKPARITAGTVGLPVEFAFDSAWADLSKTAVFMAGKNQMIVDTLDAAAVVPWEILQTPGFRLNIGVYGVNVDGSVAITTTWATAGVIAQGANPDQAPSADPTLPVWQKLLNAVGDLLGLKTNAKSNLVEAINEVYDKAEAGASGMIVSDKQPTATPVLWFDTSDD